MSRAAPVLPKGPSVELCRRPADIPILKQLGVEHWWLKTARFERGMGTKDGVPGHDKVPDVPGTPTLIVDHRGESDSPAASCAPVAEEDPHWEQVDEGCLETELALHRSTGRWWPWNQCHSVLKEALDACRITGQPGSEVPPAGVVEDAGVAPTDGGAPQ